MYIRTEKYIFWVLTFIFTCGMLYSSIIRVPSLEEDVKSLNNRQTITETHYTHIKESLNRIEGILTGGK